MPPMVAPDPSAGAGGAPEPLDPVSEARALVAELRTMLPAEVEHDARRRLAALARDLLVEVDRLRAPAPPEAFRPVSWRADRDGYELHVDACGNEHRWWVREPLTGRSLRDSAPGLDEAMGLAHAAVERLVREPPERVGRWTLAQHGYMGPRWVLDGEACEVSPEPDGGGSWRWEHGASGASRTCNTRDEAMAEGERVTEALKGVLR